MLKIGLFFGFLTLGFFIGFQKIIIQIIQKLDNSN